VRTCSARRSAILAALPYLALLVVGLTFPLFGGGYWGRDRDPRLRLLGAGVRLNLVVGSPARLRLAGWPCSRSALHHERAVAGTVTPELRAYLALAVGGCGSAPSSV